MDILPILKKLAELWNPLFCIEIGVSLFGLTLLKLFFVPDWYMMVSGAFMIVGTAWWIVKAVRNR
jgi:hypothetical protein